MIGTSLGPYKIIEQLGAGGMGEVFLADDTRLGRKVAIKVLPSEFASDAERLARFDQEARAAAALNHPHIAVVHDVGAETGDDGAVTHFMVQEHLEGEPLRASIDKGALPVKRALELGIEIAGALQAAHAAGIVHRDLKPENIFVSKSGHAKVLDFGLAKLTEMIGPGDAQASRSPTMMGTVAGQVMGTAGYMASEQVQGEPDIDQRADLFAFGCVLYEMVSGRQPFVGKSVVQTLNRIAHEEPEPLDSIVTAVPVELQRIVKKCLAKEPAKRYQSAADLVVDLQLLAGEVEAGTAVSTAHEAVGAAPAPMATRAAMLVGLGGFALGALAVGAVAWMATRPSPQPPTKLAVTMSPPEFGAVGPPLVAISPDGRSVAFTGRDQLYRRDMEHLEVVPIPGTAGANTPSFSPDGRWLVFQRGGLEKVSMAGGPTQRLCESNARGISWGFDDTIVFGTVGGGLWRVQASGADCRQLTTLEEDTAEHWRPDILPDGAAAVFTVWSGSLDTAQLAVVNLATGEHSLLGVGGTYPRYAHTGHLIFARASSLWAVAFDADARQVIGDPVPVLEGVSVVATSGAAQFELTDTGSLLYMPSRGESAEGHAMVWVDRDGNEEPLPAPMRVYRDPAISPDGTKIAVTIDEENNDVYVWDISREALSRFTFSDANDSTPVWSADGTRLAFASDRDGWGLYAKAAAGTGAIELLAATGERTSVMSWSDDNRIAFQGMAESGVLALDDASAAPDLLLRDDNRQELRPSLSPDGRWLAYESEEVDAYNVVVRPFPISGDAQWQVSVGWGGEPHWGADGKELFFLGPDSRTSLGGTAIHVVQIETEPTFSHSPPQPLFDVEPYRMPRWPRRFAVSPDGTRFLLMKPVGAANDDAPDSPGLVIVLNWLDELAAMVPSGS